MSLNYNPIKPVLVQDPRVNTRGEELYSILESGTRFTPKAWTSTSISTSNINFSCPPPSSKYIVDRRISLTLPVRLILYADVIQPGFSVINPGGDAPRAFGIHSSLDTINLSINNCSISQNMGEIIHALLRYNGSDDLFENDYSETPSYLDQSQSYSDLFGTNRSPLAMSGASPNGAIPARGAFSQYHVVHNDRNDNPPGGPTTSGWAVVDMVLSEQLMISPLVWGKWCENQTGLINVTSMDFTFNFLNQSNRFWSHDQNAGSHIPDNSCQIAFNNFVNLRYPGQPPNINYQFHYGSAQPTLNINYITPRPNSMIGSHHPLSYNYFDLNKYATDTSTALSYGQSSTFQSNNIQLSAIPRRVYIFAREENRSYYSNVSRTDTFYAIDNISIQFENQSGLLAQATQNQLWQLSRKNNCNISWQDWNGKAQYKEGTYDNSFGSIGSIVALDFATDIGLEDYMAPGMGGQYNLQVQATVRNCDPSGDHDNSNISLYILTVLEGTFTTTQSGNSITQLSILSEEDVIHARADPNVVSYNDIQDVSGGNFFSGLKRNLKRYGPSVNKFLKDSKAISKTANALSVLPGPQQNLIRLSGRVAQALGYGENDELYQDNNTGGVLVREGGILMKVGGVELPKKTLRGRARNT